MPNELYVMRDPSGNQPLVLGKKNGNYLISSENCGFVMIEGELIRNLLPGEILRINSEGVTSQTLETKAQKRCIYEYLYYARPDSVIDGIGIYDARMHFGRKLAQVLPVEADMVVGVPDSALAAAAGYAEASGIPQGDGLYKNRYSGISKATLQKRDRGVRLKLNAIKENVAGKRIILIDDSIVAGTTSKWIVEMLKNAGATEVHLRIASPAFQRPCCYGLYSFSQSKLIGAGHSEEEMKAMMGVDSFACLSLDMMLEGLDMNPDDFCGQCFQEKLK
jgi:amidophosphoribosyltransferase